MRSERRLEALQEAGEACGRGCEATNASCLSVHSRARLDHLPAFHLAAGHQEPVGSLKNDVDRSSSSVLDSARGFGEGSKVDGVVRGCVRSRMMYVVRVSIAGIAEGDSNVRRIRRHRYQYQG